MIENQEYNPLEWGRQQRLRAEEAEARVAELTYQLAELAAQLEYWYQAGAALVRKAGE